MPVILPSLPPGMSAMSYARQGLAQASDALETAAGEVAAGTTVALNAASDPSALVELSPEAIGLMDGLDDALVGSKVAQHSYTANAAVIRAADEQSEELVRIGRTEA